MPFFSVLISTFNYGCYIEAAIESVIAQTLRRDDFEILVIDDGSTDDTCQRLSRFGDEVRYFYQENAGQAAAFNAGIELAKGEFIAFLDADDTWCQEKLEYLKNFLESDADIDLVYHSLIMVDDSGAHLGVHPKYGSDVVLREPLTALPDDVLMEPAATSGIIGRTDILRSLMPIPISYRICADSYIAVTAPLIVSAVAYLSRPLTYYRIHSCNGYSSYNKDEDRYDCLDTKILTAKAKLDVLSLEDVSRRLGLESHDYCSHYRSYLTVLEIIFVRKHSGVISGLIRLYHSRNILKRNSSLISVYRLISLVIRILLGDRIFNTILKSYYGTSLRKRIHSLINS